MPKLAVLLLKTHVVWRACDCGTDQQNHLLPGPSGAFHNYFKGNEEYVRRFYSDRLGSYPRRGYWRQFEEIASARQSSRVRVAVQKLLVQLWAENHELLESGESRACRGEKNLQRVKLLNKMQDMRRQTRVRLHSLCILQGGARGFKGGDLKFLEQKKGGYENCLNISGGMLIFCKILSSFCNGFKR